MRSGGIAGSGLRGVLPRPRQERDGPFLGPQVSWKPAAYQNTSRKTCSRTRTPQVVSSASCSSWKPAWS